MTAAKHDDSGAAEHGDCGIKVWRRLPQKGIKRGGTENGCGI